MPATVVYSLESQQTKLIVDSNFKNLWLEFPKRVENNPKVITPKYVAEAIKFALEVGWEPSSNKGKFEIKYSDGKFQKVDADSN